MAYCEYNVYNICSCPQIKTVKILPVNLKKYFHSYTSSNFFSYIDVNVDTNKEKTFNNILEKVKKEFKDKLTEEELLKTIAINLRLTNNYAIRIVPLFLNKLLYLNLLFEYY